MGANEKLGLPRDRMKKITVAFDVDGTLRCNCTRTCRGINTNIYCLLVILSGFKNVKIVVWSGGGADYARSFWNSTNSQNYLEGFKIKTPTFESKLNYVARHGQPDIAIDDIQDTAIGKVNLIVWEK